MDTKIIMITSCKGGVGKSTISANLALSLAKDGHKTLLIDCDFGNRSLDLFLGLQNRIIYDLSDLILHDISPDRVLISEETCPNLYFCAAPYDLDEDQIPHHAFSLSVSKLIDTCTPEYVLIDTPGNIGHSFRLAASVATEAYVISTCQPVAIRAAERTGSLLEELGVEYRRLIINMFAPSQFSSAPDSSPLAIIDDTCLRLLGIIPFDPAVMTLQAEGKSVYDIKRSDVPAAYRNILARIHGNNVPLFTGFRLAKRSKLMNTL